MPCCKPGICPSSSGCPQPPSSTCSSSGTWRGGAIRNCWSDHLGFEWGDFCIFSCLAYTLRKVAAHMLYMHDFLCKDWCQQCAFYSIVLTASCSSCPSTALRHMHCLPFTDQMPFRLCHTICHTCTTWVHAYRPMIYKLTFYISNPTCVSNSLGCFLVQSTTMLGIAVSDMSFNDVQSVTSN